MKAVRALLIAALVVILLPYVLVPFYRTGHPVSTLMLWRMATGSPVDRRWLDLNEFAGSLAPTVIAAEDAKFCSHAGIDWDALQGAIEDAQDGEIAGGGSTITQQVAKNLFLWPGRSFIRKGLEIPLALWLDAVLTKSRILELYLNVAEWGPKGQFGAEAGAQYAFGRSAFAISPSQSALLAAILPNPIDRSAGQPSAAVRRRAAIYVIRARTSDLTDCLKRRVNSHFSAEAAFSGGFWADARFPKFVIPSRYPSTRTSESKGHQQAYDSSTLLFQKFAYGPAAHTARTSETGY